MSKYTLMTAVTSYEKQLFTEYYHISQMKHMNCLKVILTTHAYFPTFGSKQVTRYDSCQKSTISNHIHSKVTFA